MATSAGAAIFKLDSLEIIKPIPDLYPDDDVMLFDDYDADGVTPGEPYRNENPSNYSVQGNVTESDGRLVFDTAGGDLVFGSNRTLFSRSRVTLKTNIDNNNLGAGLKDVHTFTVTALFYLGVPGPIGEAYELRLNDGVSGVSGNDLFALRVYRGNDDQVGVRAYVDRDGSGSDFNWLSNRTLLDLDDLDNKQIALRFDKAIAGTKTVDASWAYVIGGAFGTWNPAGSADLFTGERFTRVQAQAWSPVPLPAAAWLFIGALGMLGMTARRRS